MRYYANRRFSVTHQGTEEQINYQVGDIIGDFGLWPDHARRNNIACGNVAPVIDPPLKDDGAVVEVETRNVRPDVVKALRDGLPKEAAPADDDQLATDVQDGVPCPLCPRMLANERALKSHRTRMHGGL